MSTTTTTPKMTVEDRLKNWLAEYGYDSETQTMKVHVNPGVMSFLLGLSQLTGESPRDAVARLLIEQLRAIMNGNLDPKVIAAIEEAYFSEDV